MENKKIMMISTTDNMIWQFMLPHIKHLQEMGNVVECVCSKTGFWFDELQNKYGLTVHEINFERSPISFKNFKSYKKLKKLQKEQKYNLIYCQQPVGGLMGRLIAKKFKIPCIYTAHGFHFFKGNSKIKNFIFKTVEKYLSKFTDALITINEEDFQNARTFKAKKVYKINGIGINNEKMNLPKDFKAEDFKKKLGFNKTDKLILTVSELNDNKNYTTMLQSIKNLVDENKNIHFVSCGCGIKEKEIKEFANELGIQNNCHFLMYRKDIAQIMSISDVFFHASHREGLTLSVMEAMSVGLPCVVSNVRGNRDLIKNNVNGFVCEDVDYEKFAESIKKLLTNKELYNNIKDNNLQDSKKYAIKNVIAELDSIYEEID